MCEYRLICISLLQREEIREKLHSEKVLAQEKDILERV
jgi:hypothetical protein